MISYHKHLAESFLSLSTGLALALSLSGCQPNNNHSATNNTQTDSPTQTANSDANATPAPIATQIQFPQYIKGWSTLLHPVSPLSLTAEQDESLSSIKSRDEWQPTIFAETQPYTYQTYISNIVFEDLATGLERKLLVDNSFIIRSIFIPHITKKRVLKIGANTIVNTTDGNILDGAIVDNTIVDNTIFTEIEPDNTTDKVYRTQQLETINTLFKHAIYHINETPNQEDAKDKNIFEQQALYMSDDKGNQLVKLHPDNEFIHTTKWLPQLSRYYFITRSDSDGNGLIDDKDQTHNYQIDFSKDTPIVKGYDFKK